MLNREMLRQAFFTRGESALIVAINKSDYRVGQFENGSEVITTDDASDWIALPTANFSAWFWVQWDMIPRVDMGR